MVPPKKLELGMEVKDRVTGFTGIATARHIYLQGCNRISIQPKAMEEDTKLPEAISIDEPDLEVIGYGVLPIPEEKDKKPGGPRRVALRPGLPRER